MQLLRQLEDVSFIISLIRTILGRILNQVGKPMSYDIFADPTVKSPGTGRDRRGRGFSRHEIEEAGLAIDEARRMGLIVDVRRKTSYDENIEVIKQYINDLEEFAAEVSSATSTIDADAVIAELSSLRAVKKSEAQLLFDAGIRSLEDLAYCDISKTANKTGIDEERLTAMVKAAFKKVS